MACGSSFRTRNAGLQASRQHFFIESLRFLNSTFTEGAFKSHIMGSPSAGLFDRHRSCGAEGGGPAPQGVCQASRLPGIAASPVAKQTAPKRGSRSGVPEAELARFERKEEGWVCEI